MTIWSLGKTPTKEKLISGSSATLGTSKPTALVDAVTGPNHDFGIRSYLHQFYQSPIVEESPTSSAWYLLPPPPSQRKGLFMCHVLSIFSLLILLGGAATIVAGYTWPHQSIEDVLRESAQAYDDDGRVWLEKEDFAKLFQDPMRRWKMIAEEHEQKGRFSRFRTGLCIFSVGASLLALSLLIPTIAQCFRSKRLAGFASEDATPNEPPIRIYPSVPAKPEGYLNTQAAQISPNSEPVPVVEEITKIQPIQGKPATPIADATADDLLTNTESSAIQRNIFVA